MDALEIALIGPEAAAYQRRFGNQQMMEGTSGAPVQHWTQALNRVAQGAVGALREDGVRENEQRAAEMRKQALMNALNGGDMQGSAMEILGNPATEDMGMQLAQNVFSQRQAAEAAQARAQEQELAHQRQKDLIDYRASVANQGDETNQYSKNFQILQTNDGRFFAVQGNSNGPPKISPLTIEEAAQAQAELDAGDGQQAPTQSLQLSPAKGVMEVDDGTGTTLIDRATAQRVGRIDKDIAGAEAQKVEGKAMAEGKLALTKAGRALEMYDLKSRNTEALIDRALAIATEESMATGFTGGMTQAVPGSPAYRLKVALDPIKASIGFEELQFMRDNSPTGGALGQVSELEIRLLNSVLATLDQAQRQEDVVWALENVKRIRSEYRELKRRAYEQDVRTFGAENVPNPEAGQTPGATQPPPSQQQNTRQFRVIRD